ncbi:MULTISPECIES: GlxA family transcriptional regulator [unclassified Halomonas]|uniref:GlxA family transcriptional regulator n=1 Tax=unclassified Halomonas TaxID=2609666 RepID=UPI0020769F34|nr:MULTISPECIES: GlxA family transcriptional regulator [unclassified Halomonas]
MRLEPPATTPEKIGFLLLPRFAMVAFFSAIEPLRIANRLSGTTLFQWQVISRDGASVIASNGMSLEVDTPMQSATSVTSLAVCASFEPLRAIDDVLLDWLRAQKECVLGGVDTGCYALAAAGLLDDSTVTLHWECLPDFRRRFPHVDAVESVFEVDSSSFSCAGGSAAIDMSLDLIRRRHGEALCARVREQLIHDQGRLPASRQRDPVTPANPLLERAIALMESRLESPLPVSALAQELGISWRRLERLFSQHLGTSPQRAYQAKRLEHAHQLLSTTSLSVVQVGLACGFASPSSFARAFRRQHGVTPSQLRQRGVSNRA